MTVQTDSAFLRGLAGDYEGRGGFYEAGRRLLTIADRLALDEAKAEEARVHAEVGEFLSRMARMWTDRAVAERLIADLSPAAHAKLAAMNVLNPR